jgi:hypothetical protein
MKFLLLQLMLGMSKTYSIGCRKLVDEFDEEHRPLREVEAVRLCLIGKSGVSHGTLTSLLERPEVLEREETLAHRLLLFRSGKYEELLARPHDLESYCLFSDWFLRAMALEKLGRHDEAVEWYSRGELQFSGMSPREHAWWDHVMCGMLQAEAAELIAPSSDDKPAE